MLTARRVSTILIGGICTGASAVSGTRTAGAGTTGCHVPSGKAESGWSSQPARSCITTNRSLTLAPKRIAQERSGIVAAAHHAAVLLLAVVLVVIHDRSLPPVPPRHRRPAAAHVRHDAAVSQLDDQLHAEGAACGLGVAGSGQVAPDVHLGNAGSSSSERLGDRGVVRWLT